MMWKETMVSGNDRCEIMQTSVVRDEGKRRGDEMNDAGQW